MTNTQIVRKITQINPACIQAGVQTTISIFGGPFRTSSTVQVVSGGTIGATTYVSASQLNVNITPSATSTQYVLRVSTIVGGVTRLTDNYIIDVSPTITSNVIWTNLTGATATGNTINTKTAANGWGNCGPHSTLGISGCGGYMEFTVKSITTTQNEMIGLNNNHTFDTNWTSIDHAIYLSGTANTANGFVYEDGVFAGSLGACPNGTVLRIEIYNNTIRYYRNGILTLTRQRQGNFPYYVDTSIFSTGISRISNVIISGNLT